RAEHEYSAGPESVVKDRQQPRVRVRLQVDENITAADDVEVRERRIRRDVLHREDTAIAHRLRNAITGIFLSEEAIQPLRRDIGLDASRVHARAGGADGGRVEVGCETLDRRTECMGSSSSSRQIAIEYASSPVEHPATHT